MEADSRIATAFAEDVGLRARHFAPIAQPPPKRLGEVARKGALREAKNRSKEIRSRAEGEKRPLSPLEEEQIRGSDRASTRALIGSILLNKIESIKREAKRAGLNSHHIEMLKVFDRNGSPEAEELLQKYSKNVQPKPRKLELTAKQQHLMDTLPKATARRYARFLASSSRSYSMQDVDSEK